MTRKDYFVRFAYTVLISATIFATASTLVGTVDFTALSLTKSVALGVAIWLAAELLTELAARRWPHRMMPAYIAMFIVIAFGTGMGTWMMGLGSAKIILLICVFAEAFGFIIAIAYHIHYTKKLNEQLVRYKTKIDEKD